MHFSQSFAAKLTAGLLAVTGTIAPAFAVSGTVDAEGGLRLRNASSTDAAVLETSWPPWPAGLGALCLWRTSFPAVTTT